MRLHPIVVDDREKRPAPATRVQELTDLGVPARVGRVPNGHGDYRWLCEPEGDGEWFTVSLERKSVKDLLASVADGRLGRFTNKYNPGELRALLVEGDLAHTAQFGAKQWTEEELDNVLASVQTRGVLVIRSKGGATTARRIASFWRWTGKQHHDTLDTVQRPQLPSGTASARGNLGNDHRSDDSELQFLMGLPGVGYDRAAKLRGLRLQHGHNLGRLLDGFRRRDYSYFSGTGVGRGTVDKAATFLEDAGVPTEGVVES